MSLMTFITISLLALSEGIISANVKQNLDGTALSQLSDPLQFFQWSSIDDSPFQTAILARVGGIQKGIDEIIKRSKREDNYTQNKQTKQINADTNFHELLEKIDKLDNFAKSSVHLQTSEDDFRERRDSEKPMEKIGEVKTVDRQPSQRSEFAKSWSKQPIAVEFRHRTNLDEINPSIPNEDPWDTSRNHYPPKTDFVTGSRRYYTGEREGRDLVMPRQTYEDYDMHPVFRSYSSRGRDYQVPMTRAFYPNRYKGDGEPYYRVPIDMKMKSVPGSIPLPYQYNRYRFDAENDDQFVDSSYGRFRPPGLTKPKRIIYYATLPEIVRKPVDIRNYPRYNGLYPAPSRSPNIDRNGIKIRPSNIIDPTKRPYNKFPYPVYKYSNLDGWNKRPNQYEQLSQIPYNRDQERREQNRVTQNKENFQGADSLDDNTKQMNLNRLRPEDQRTSWMPTSSEENIKGNERNSERHNYSSAEEYGDRNNYQHINNNSGKDMLIDQEMSDT